MEFCEIEGERKGSKVLVTEDKHLYRYAKPNTPYLICYLGEITKTMQKTSPHVAKCPATATLKEGKINEQKEIIKIIQLEVNTSFVMCDIA